jgi:hypothetical protein
MNWRTSPPNPLSVHGEGERKGGEVQTSCVIWKAGIYWRYVWDTKMEKYKVNKDELVIHLSDQISFLIDSAISFDNGFEGESKRLAAVIRILVHDTTKSSSLLTQLNKMKILFIDSANVFLDNPIPQDCLTMTRLSKKEGETALDGDYIAPLDNRLPNIKLVKKIGFNRWWNQNIVVKDKNKNVFKRKDLILVVADKEGGAHVDPELDQAYVNLAKFNSLAWVIYTEDGKKDMGNPIPPSIRQISHEIIRSLKDGVADLFPRNAILFRKFEEYEKHCLQLSIQQGFKKEDANTRTTG